MGNAIDNAAIAQSVRRDGMQLTNTNNGMGQVVGIPMGMQNQQQHRHHHHHHHHQHQHQQFQRYPMPGQQQQQQQVPQPQPRTPQMIGNAIMNNGNGLIGQPSMMTGGSVWSNEVIVGGITTPAKQNNNAIMTPSQPQPLHPSSSMNTPQMYRQQMMNGNQMMSPSTPFNQQQLPFPSPQQPQQVKTQQLLSPTPAFYPSAVGNNVNVSTQQRVYQQPATSMNAPQLGQGVIPGQPAGGPVTNGQRASINGMKYNTNQITHC